MPNYIENHIFYEGDPQDIDDMLEKIKSDAYGKGTIDFEKIIPTPQYEDDLYHWCINNWGTKWDAFGYDEATDYSNNNELWFQTANSAPNLILKKLSQMYPAIKFTHQWADEDLGRNCGERTYQNGEMISEYFPETEKEAYEFSAKVWDYDLEEIGLRLNLNGDNYIYTNLEDFELINLLGKPALFTVERLTENDVPKGLNLYHLRSSDGDEEFSTIEPSVKVNHAGSVITNETLDFGDKGYIELDDDDIKFIDCAELSIDDYVTENFSMEEQTGGMDLCQ
jgi:hypothetical protein